MIKDPNYQDTVSDRKPSGHILIDGVVVADTKQCCHCAAHFVMRKGSGTIRGFCMKCMKITCGRSQCDECRPWKKWLEEARQK